jgi:hypothetical protein
MNGFLREKAVFQIIVLIVAIFAFAFFMNSEEVSGAGNMACCEKVQGSDALCIFTEVEKCASDGMKRVGTSCESSGFCDVGCCYDTSDGVCAKNVNKAACVAQGGSWDADPSCSIDICQQGCCVTPAGCAIVTKNKCKKSVEGYSGLTFSQAFKAEITDELECSATCKSAEKGCCVPSDPTAENCFFGYRSECTSGTFKEGEYCSHVQECECTKEYKKNCLSGEQSLFFEQNDDVHWFDSCGNPEQVVGTQYTGYLDSVVPVSGCSEKNGENYETNPEKKDCGYCDVISGSTCGTSKIGGKEEFVCKSLDCGSEHGEEFRWKWDAGSKKWMWNAGGNDNFVIKNDDAWCYYESATGTGQDLVGTRHHLFRCVNGEITREDGPSDRSKVCVMDFSSDGSPSASMVINDVADCIGYNQDSSECGGDCAGIEKEYDRILCCNKQRCLNSGKMCYWDSGANLCGSMVAPGGTENCGQMDGMLSCSSVWEYKPLHWGGSPWECKANCGCWDKVEEFNRYCNSLGDCGAGYNIAGVMGEGGWRGGYTFKDNDGHKGITNANLIGANQNTPTYEFSTVKSPSRYLEGNLSDLFVMLQGITDYYADATRDWSTATNLPGREKIQKYFGTSGRIAGILGTDGSGNLWKSPLVYLGATYVINLFVFAINQGISLSSLAIGPLTGVFGVGGYGLTNILGANLLTGAIFWGLMIWTAWNIVNLVGGRRIEVKYEFKCQAWSASSKAGEQRCDMCTNDDKNPFAVCDETRCTSLGAQCKFEGKNPDGTDAEVGICTKTRGDTIPPKISYWDAEVNERKYRPLEAGVDSGYEILGEFSGKEPIVVGVKTDKLAGCWISRRGDLGIEAMSTFGGGGWQTEHKVELTFASDAPDDTSLDIFGGGQKSYYVTCKDIFGNVKSGYKIQFKVKEQPPVVAPTIKKFEPKSGAYVPYGAEKTNMYILVDAPVYNNVVTANDSVVPAGCRYTIDSNKAYLKDFEGLMSCSNTLIRDSEGVSGYQCYAVLENLKNNQDNTFYFRCKDIYGNANEQNQPVGGYHLIGTSELLVKDAGPSSVIYSTNLTLTAETSDGAEEGISECRYSLSETKENEGAVLYEGMGSFSSTNSKIHKHSLVLNDGKYYVVIKCRDKAGNEAVKSTEFTINTKAYPTITRIYTGEDKLNIILDHDTDSCKYDTESNLFSFTESTNEMAGAGDNEFQLYIGEDSKFFIKCRDKLTGQLSPAYTIYV